jgi:AcrR family transcriptional regulator
LRPKIYDHAFGNMRRGMGRSRKLDRKALLDAAQEVLSRDGASNLTIEAVAANAGVGKATVLYDYKSKHALVSGLARSAPRWATAPTGRSMAGSAARCARCRGRTAQSASG